LETTQSALMLTSFTRGLLLMLSFHTVDALVPVFFGGLRWSR
jgi:hypothetical protein